MIRKSLLAVGLTTALMAPAGIALAQTDDEAVDTEAAVTAEAPDQVRSQQRLQDPALCDEEADQLRTQLRLYATEAGYGPGEGAGYGPGEGAGLRGGPGDGTGPFHDEVVANGGAGGTGYRGALQGIGERGAGPGDGTGPFHEEVVENGGMGGTGYRGGA